MANVVSYVLSLEGRSFFVELVKARSAAKDAAKGISDGFRESQMVGQGFLSAQTALSAAMRGDLVTAATAGAKAMSGLARAMSANPILAVVSALVGLGAVLYKVAKAHEEYRDRVREARKENELFLETVAQMGQPAPLEEAEAEMRERMEEGKSRRVERAVTRAESNAEAAKEKVESAQAELLAAQTAKKPDEKLVEELKAKRDAAVEEYKLQLSIVVKYREMYAEWQKARESTLEKEKAAADELREANAAESWRLEKAGAEGDLNTMSAILVRMTESAREKYGDERFYGDRLKAGTASKDEMEARREIDEWAKKIEAEARRQRDEAARAAEAAAREAEQQARAEQAAAGKLARAREDAMVAAGDEKGLRQLAAQATKEADEKFGTGFEKRIGKATQEELDIRERAARLTKEADAVRRSNSPEEKETKEERRKAERPWVEGVVAARNMSVADVFNNMRGMNGAHMAKDPNTELHRKTAEVVGSISRDVQAIARSLSREGVF